MGVIILIPFTRMEIDEDVSKIMLGREIDAYFKQAQQYCQNKAKI